jgi:CheY-like chemotaxis protein
MITPMNSEKISENTSRSIKFLIVAGDENCLELFLTFLSSAYNNCVVDTAKDSKAAIDLAIEQSPDLIINDIIWSEGGGIELIRFLKAKENTKHIPIFALPGILSPEYLKDEKEIARATAIEAMLYREGFNKVICHPFGFKQLIEAIDLQLNVKGVMP